MPSPGNSPQNAPPPAVPVTQPVPADVVAAPLPTTHGPIAIPQQPGMPAPIVPKAMGGVIYPNDRITDASVTPLVPPKAAAAEAELAPKKGTPADPSATDPISPGRSSNASDDDKPNEEKLEEKLGGRGHRR